jgi:uncharacterized protein YfbU (UPF0304 family)
LSAGYGIDMTEEFENMIEAYNQKIIENNYLYQFIKERGLNGDLSEWVNEKKLAWRDFEEKTDDNTIHDF